MARRSSHEPLARNLVARNLVCEGLGSVVRAWPLNGLQGRSDGYARAAMGSAPIFDNLAVVIVFIGHRVRLIWNLLWKLAKISENFKVRRQKSKKRFFRDLAAWSEEKAVF